METFRFLKFPVYFAAKDLYLEIVRVAETIKDFALKDQILRASLSIVLNIAEGSAKHSDKDFARYLQISIGSVNEVVACLDIMLERKILDEIQYKLLLKKSEGVAKQLGGFIRNLHTS